MKRSILWLVLCLFLLSGCGAEPAATEPSEKEPFVTNPFPTEAAPSSDGEVSEETRVEVPLEDPSDLFSDRDYRTDYDSDDSVSIRLNGSSISAGKGVSVEGTTATITKKGTYVLSGTLDDGMIIVDVDKDDKVQLVLSGVKIRSETCAPIYIRQADKVFLTLASGTENILSGGDSFTSMDGNDIDAVIFSKEDLTLNGEGSLQISSPAGHGIVSKDELTVTSGTYSITAASHGITGKDNVCIAGGNISVTAGKDGIRSENGDDATLGFIHIEGGSFSVTCEGDGISASGYIRLRGGEFALKTGGGSSSAQKQSSNVFGGFGGGRPGGQSSATTVDTASAKGIKATALLFIEGGSHEIDSRDDALHSNADVTVLDGQFVISTGDDGIHADETLTVSGGNIRINESYEGMEGLNIHILGGDIHIVSDDDGLNAAGGVDSSGFGGFGGGGDRFGGGRGGMGGMGGGSSNSQTHISGGTLYINASGDGIDCNGSLTISGGHTVVCGPTQGDTAVLDYDTTGTITGGTFIGTGSYMMAQTFSQVENQGIIALSVGNQYANTAIVLEDSQGNTLLSVTPEENFAIVILCTPEMVKGETYTVRIGSQSGSFEAS